MGWLWITNWQVARVWVPGVKGGGAYGWLIRDWQHLARAIVMAGYGAAPLAWKSGA